jgi:hypothetical protein
MCTCARPYGRVGRCGFGGQGVTDKIINDANNAYQIQATSDDVYMSCGCWGLPKKFG